MKILLQPASAHVFLLGAAITLTAPAQAHPPSVVSLAHPSSSAVVEQPAVTAFSQMLLSVMRLRKGNLGSDNLEAENLKPVRPAAQSGVSLAQADAASTTQISQTQNQVQIDIRDGYRYITANGIPNHSTGTFPNSGNPNRISPQNHSFRITLTPEYTGVATAVRPVFGVALNGIPFEPGTAEFWNRDRNWNYDALSGHIDLGTDANNAHVQPSGSYHYHGLPTSLVEGGTMTLLGYAADGFPIYGPYGYRDTADSDSGLVELQSSYRLKAGQRSGGPGGSYDGTFVADFEYVAGLGDLDQCNGRFGVTPEHPEGTYHYYVTDIFPFVPRCVMGTPDASFQRAQGQGQRPGGRPEGPPQRGRSSSGRPEGPPPRSQF